MVIVETFLLHTGLKDCSLVGGGWFRVCFLCKDIKEGKGVIPFPYSIRCYELIMFSSLDVSSSEINPAKYR